MLQVFALDIHKTTNKDLYGVDLVLRVIRVPNDPVTRVSAGMNRGPAGALPG